MTEATLSDPWLALAVAVFVICVLAIALFAQRERRPAASTDAKLDDLVRRLGQQEEKLRQTDHDLRAVRMIVNNLPTKESIQQISLSVAESRGKIDGMQTTLGVQTATLGRIEEFLLRASADAIVGLRAGKGE